MKQFDSEKNNLNFNFCFFPDEKKSLQGTYTYVKINLLEGNFEENLTTNSIIKLLRC